MSAIKRRILSIYLPQFHPLPENDRFWGKGFTEWHNVTSAKPLFPGHYQPHLPTELGFYDLRVQEVMQKQCELAAQYAIDGFIFYHYWFNGKPLMEKPLNNYLAIKESKLPYFFCWANENWSRRWDGSDEEVLLKQDYCKADDEKHLEFFEPFFRDEHYIKIDNRPVIGIYRPQEIPDVKNWVSNMNALARKKGLEGIYFIYFINLGIDKDIDVREYGFDAGLVFQPSWNNSPAGGSRVGFIDKLGKLFHLLKMRDQLPLRYRYEIIDYSTYVEYEINQTKKYPFKCFPSLFPMWDNSARRKKGGGKVFINSGPGQFKKWLHHCYNSFHPYSSEEDFVVINAWNEWAEGNHLEPCIQWKRSYLEAVKEVVNEKVIE